MENIGQTVVTHVTMDIQQTNCKFNVSFDFDANVDTVIEVAKELQDTGITGTEISMTDLMRKIELAIIGRCDKIAAQAAIPEENQKHIQVEETTPTIGVGTLLQDA